MRIDPVLRALRHDEAPQRHAQEALETVRNAWRRRPAIAGALAEFDAYGTGAGLAQCPLLAEAVGSAAGARQFIAPLFDAMVRTLASQPIGQIPFRHQYAGGISVMLLGESGRATLSLVTYEEQGFRRQPPARSVAFNDGERRECYLAGSGAARLYTLVSEQAGCARWRTEDRPLGPGDTLAMAGPDRAKQVTAVAGRLVMLRLSRVPDKPHPAREYRLEDGRLVHRASGDPRESRDEMMLALLGRMGRADAVPAIAQVAGEGSDHLRWQAVRQCLALDTRAGFALLCRIAADGADPLAAPAGALRASLVEQHPVLADGARAPCPA